MAGMHGGRGATARPVGVVALCAWALCAWNTTVHAAAVPILAQGAAGLVAPPLNEAAKPVRQPAPEGGEAGAEPGAEAETPAKLSLQAHLMKYGPSYVLTLLLVALGTSIACVPRPGTLGQTDAGKGKGPGKK